MGKILVNTENTYQKDSFRYFLQSYQRATKLYLTKLGTCLIKNKSDLVVIHGKKKYIPDNYFKDNIEDGDIINISFFETIEYIKQNFNCEITINQHGIMLIRYLGKIDEIHVYNYVALNWNLASINKLITDPQYYINNLNEAQTIFNQLDFNNIGIKYALFHSASNFGRVFITANLLRRVYKIYQLGNIPKLINGLDVLRIKKALDKKRRIPSSNDDLTAYIATSNRDKKTTRINIKDIFSVDTKDFNIRLIGSKSYKNNPPKKGIHRNTLLYFNYIKYMGELDNLIFHLEYKKLSNL